jgi:competence protein ComEC
MAASAALGALRPAPLPLLVGAAALVAGLLIRQPAVVCVAVAVCASSLAQRAIDGLDGLAAAEVRAEVVLLTDPEPSFDGVRAEALLQGRHLEVRAGRSTAAALADRLAGEHLVVRGALRADGRPDAWALVRHLAGELTVHRVDSSAPGARPWRVANGLRRTIIQGTEPLDHGQRALFAGLVLGDDRAQSAALADDFRGAGLTHLLAVSGQNVAFATALVGPVGRRLRILPRLLLTVGVIVGFALMTRFEPSVLRASVMAGLAASTRAAGWPAQRLRVLCVAITALVLIDPMLVRSVGFQLSVGATVSIALLAEPLAGVVPGPRWLREALGVTVAAQLGVAPVLLGRFGPLPLASLPANVLAVPAAGLVMMWGLTAGVVAGAVGGPLAEVLHLPTRGLLLWLEVVARRSAALPIGEVGAAAALLLAAGLLALVAGRRSARHWVATIGRVLVVATLVGVVVLRQVPVPLRTDLGSGIVRWHHGSTDVVTVGSGDWRAQVTTVDVLGALRRRGVGSIELLVVNGVPDVVVEAILERHPTGAVVTARPESLGARVVNAVRPPTGPVTVPVGSLLVTLVPGQGRVVVEARPAAGPTLRR